MEIIRYLIFFQTHQKFRQFNTSLQGELIINMPLLSDLVVANPTANFSRTECVTAPMAAVIETMLKLASFNSIPIPMKNFNKRHKKDVKLMGNGL